jgi:hypothetical protein
VVAYGFVLYGAWQLGEAMAEAPWNPFTHPRDLPNPRVRPRTECPPLAIPLPRDTAGRNR